MIEFAMSLLRPSRSPEVLYHAVVQSDTLVNASSIELEGETTASPPTRPNPHTEARIRWTYFILGCAVLLPWNGTLPTPLCLVLSDLTYPAQS